MKAAKYAVVLYDDNSAITRNRLKTEVIGVN